MYELRQDMNKLLKHQRMSFNAMLPLHPSFQIFLSILLVRVKMSVRRTVVTHWPNKMCLLLNLEKMKILNPLVLRWLD
jgi:hypothetical protein